MPKTRVTAMRTVTFKLASRGQESPNASQDAKSVMGWIEPPSYQTTEN
jgi:hypothetical protein